MRSQKPDCRGFTMIELMIVLVVVALLAVVIFPRIFKTSAKSYMSTAVSELAAISSQVESKCAVTGGIMPSNANMQNFVSQYPPGYGAPIFNASPACSGYTIGFINSINTVLPDICIQRQSNGTFQYGATASSTFSPDDVPANINSSISCPSH